MSAPGVLLPGDVAWESDAEREERRLTALRADLGRALASFDAVVRRARRTRGRVTERRSARAPRALTLGQLGERCLAALELREATRTTWERLWRVHVVPALGGREAAAIERADVRAVVSAVRAPYVANRVFELVRRVYSWAHEHDLVAASPCAGLRKPHRERSSERVLSGAELVALMASLERLAPSAYTDAVWLLLATVVRERNVIEARVEQLEGLDGPEPLWRIEAGQMKAARSHVVPLVGRALTIFRRRAERAQERGTPWLFPHRHDLAQPAAWSSRFRGDLRAEVARQAGATVPRWTIHNLRHTVATRMREALRVPADVVDLLLAHRRAARGASLVYDRATLLPERRAALVAWAAHLEGLRGGEGRESVVVPLSRPDPRPEGASVAADGTVTRRQEVG